jgi:two-component system, sensor histidine kinase
MSETALTQQPSAARDEQIRVEQVRSLYLHSPTTTIGSLVAGAALVAAMWPVVAHTVLGAWMLALMLHQTLRVYHYLSFMWAGPDSQREPYWRMRYLLAVTVAGVIWGSAGVLMYVPGSLPHQAMLTLILFGIATVSMISLSAYSPAFHILIPLVMLPVLVRMLLDPGAAHIYLAIPGIIVFVVVLSFGRTVNRISTESLRKRFENVDLVQSLTRQTAIAEAARMEAEAANRSKTQFFAAASHDLRQPLHAMGLFATALHEKVKDPQVSDLVDSINDSVGALEGLFNELLDVSKIDSGVIKPSIATFNVGELLQRLGTQFHAECREKGLRLIIAPTRRYAKSDPVLVERILCNLISNAIRYTARGGVLVGCRWRAEAVRIEVWDTGAGIPAEHHEHIFEEFYQLDNPGRTSKKGLGLGLSIVRRLCALLGAPIDLRSEPGSGTVFGFELPAAAAVTASEVHDEPLPGARLDGRLIVVIDDEERIVSGMTVLLESWGADVIASLTGDDVVDEVIRRGRMPDLIIADYRLTGGVIGTDVVERIREQLDPEIPVLLVTGSTAPERITEADAERYTLLLKPVQSQRLREVIKTKLRERTA